MSGFVERELAVARGMAACCGDDARLDEADAEIAELRAPHLRKRRVRVCAAMRRRRPLPADAAAPTVGAAASQAGAILRA